MIKMLKNLGAKEWLFMALSVGFIVVQVWLDLTMPDYMKELTTLIQTEGSAMSEVLATGGMMLLCALGSLASALVVGYFAARVAAALSRRLRGRLYEKVMDFSMEEINRFSTPSLINRTTNDVTQVQMLIAMGLQFIIKAPITAVWAVIKIAGKSWQWTAVTGGAVVVLAVMITVLIVFALPKFKKIQRLNDDLNRVTRENLTGVRVVRAYNAENYQEEKFEKVNKELTNTNLYTNRMMALMSPAMSFIMSALTLAIYWIGAYLVNAAVIDVKLDIFSDMMVFSSYAMQIIMAFMMLIMIFILLPRASVSAKRINEVLGTQPRIVDGDGLLGESGIDSIEFKNVSFKYPDAEGYSLEDISLSAKRGEKIAFIGATGSGKSTLINLIPRFYDATEGEVLIGGKNVRELSQQDVRNRIGYVSQKATIFKGTIYSNVAYGDNGDETPDEDDTMSALETAQAGELIKKSEKGLFTETAQGGTNFSGGQKQRLSIARAVARNPEVYIFDDSFSALDYKTDRALRDALETRTGGAITFIVAQRIGTIRDADKIIVLDEGRIVGQGKHNELMSDCPVYREIALSQLSQKELA